MPPDDVRLQHMLDAAEHVPATPYPDVNAALSWLLAEVRAILGDHFLGMYLDGSLASGDFDPQSSDIDFVVVTAGPFPAHLLPALADMHARFAAGDSPWARRLEGSYIPRDDLRAYDPTRSPPAQFPRIEMGSALAVVQHDSDWLFHRAILHEHGVALAGPAPDTLIDPVPPDDLRRAMRGTLHEWWATMLDDPGPLRDPQYRAYAVLTMCRARYTLEHGRITSKPAAARWVESTGGPPSTDLIERALLTRSGAGSAEVRPPAIDEVQAVIRFVVDRSPA